MKPRKIICQRVKELMTCTKNCIDLNTCMINVASYFQCLCFSLSLVICQSHRLRGITVPDTLLLYISLLFMTYWSQGELISADSNFSNWDLDWKTHFRCGAKTLKLSSGSSDSFLWILARLLCYNLSYLNSNASWTSTKTLISIN